MAADRTRSHHTNTQPGTEVRPTPLDTYPYGRASAKDTESGSLVIPCNALYMMFGDGENTFLGYNARD